MWKRRPGQNPTLENRGEAYESIDKNLRYMQILETMGEYERPLTAKEIAHIMYLKGYIPTNERNFVSPRLTELSKKGFVEPCGKEICNFTGKKVSVFKIRKVEA